MALGAIINEKFQRYLFNEVNTVNSDFCHVNMCSFFNVWTLKICIINVRLFLNIKNSLCQRTLPIML